MPPTILPKALRQGDTIALISPSARLNDLLPRSLARGKAFLESLGFPIKIIYTSLPPSTTITESIHVRSEELHSAFSDPSIAAIICTIGGAHANELLPFLNYDLIRSHPKIFLGYSDTTFLHYAIESRTGLRTFYGPSILTDFSDHPSPIPFTVDHFLHVLSATSGPVGPLPRSSIGTAEHSEFLYGNDESTTPRTLIQAPSWRWLRPGCATGRLYGGTVSCVVRLQGTPYAPPSWEDKILFLESAMGDSLTHPYSVGQFRSSLVDLALSGALGQIRGLVVGRGYKYDEKMQDELAGVIVEVLDTIVGRGQKVEIPILMNVDFGHTSPFLTLPVGARVRVDAERDEVVVLEAGVEM
ncbi:S66 peptidase family protein [Aspergillus ibericus CBS 121593]|uniref:LD-carboxypeptidase n=1 Tax=Aspergillus ibericus CBS 121593 TaxID=1448316 RepID=A0A395GUR8_9EURO|nr:LD-carboxypeptidase [Aspergillus ibericus CBS 121593]RAK99255.1 LD-carboxypeptidase [Aspergillus ibericus CBS 121593]